MPTPQGAVGTGPASTTAGGSYKWWVVSMLWFICFFNYADRQMIFSVFPVLEKEFGFDAVQLGAILGRGFAFSLDGLADGFLNAEIPFVGKTLFNDPRDFSGSRDVNPRLLAGRAFGL